MAVNITITNAGSGISTLLDIYAGTSPSDLTLYIANVSKTDLMSGYMFPESPGATFYRIKDKTCNAFVDLPCNATTTTTTRRTTTTTTTIVITTTTTIPPTTTTTIPPTTTTTTTYVGPATTTLPQTTTTTSIIATTTTTITTIPTTTTSTTCPSIYNYTYENYLYSSVSLACLEGYPGTSLYSYNALALGIVLYKNNAGCVLSNAVPGAGYGYYYAVSYNSNTYAVEIDATGHVLSYVNCSSITTTTTTPAGTTTTTAAGTTTTTTAALYQVFYCYTDTNPSVSTTTTTYGGASTTTTTNVLPPAFFVFGYQNICLGAGISMDSSPAAYRIYSNTMGDNLYSGHRYYDYYGVPYEGGAAYYAWYYIAGGYATCVYGHITNGYFVSAGQCGGTTTTTTTAAPGGTTTTTTTSPGGTTTTTSTTLVYTKLLRCDTLEDRQTTEISYGSPYVMWTNGTYYYKVISQQYTTYGYTPVTSLSSVGLSDCPTVYTRLLRCDNLQDRETTEIPYSSPYPVWTNGTYYYKVISRQYTTYGYTVVTSLTSTGLSDCPGGGTTTTTTAATTTTTTFCYTQAYLSNVTYPSISAACAGTSAVAVYANGPLMTGTKLYYNQVGCTLSNPVPNGTYYRLVGISATYGVAIGNSNGQINYIQDCSLTTTTTTSVVTTTTTTKFHYNLLYNNSPQFAAGQACLLTPNLAIYSSSNTISLYDYLYTDINLTIPVVGNGTEYYAVSYSTLKRSVIINSFGQIISVALTCSTLTTTTTTSGALTTTTTTICQTVSLGYDLSDPSLACAAFTSTYRINTANFLTASKLYTFDCSTLATQGYYSNGSVYREWNGSNFVGISSSCSF